MARLHYLGDEVTAAGLRLAGVETRVVVDAAQVADALRAALDDDFECVLLSATVAPAVPPALLDEALQRDDRLVIVVPDIRGDDRLPDLTAEVRGALGLET
jgi:vacuolar-type H+-ATPase subunit F/Vma7